MAEVLKEYVIPIRFKEEGMRVQSVISSLARVGRSAVGVAGAIGGAALGFAFAAKKITQMEVNLARSKLAMANFATETGLSTRSVQAFEYAVQLAGGTTEQARSSIAGLTRTLADAQRGGASFSFLTQWGVDLNGVKTTMQLMHRIEDAVRGWKARGVNNIQLSDFLRQAGVDPALLRDILSGHLDRQMRKGGKLIAEHGMNAREMIKKSQALTDQWGRAAKSASMAWDKIRIHMMPVITEGVSGLNKMIPLVHRLADALWGLLDKLKPVASTVGTIFHFIGGITDTIGEFLGKSAWDATEAVHKINQSVTKAMSANPVSVATDPLAAMTGGYYIPPDLPKHPHHPDMRLPAGVQSAFKSASVVTGGLPAPAPRAPQQPVTVTNNITINGASDPHRTSLLLDRTLRDYADLTRFSMGSAR